MTPNEQAAQQAQAYQVNLAARQMIVRNAVIRRQQIFAGTVDPATQWNIEIAPRYAGFILGFIVNIRTNVDVAAATGTALTKTPFGSANLLSQVRFDDLSNNTRIQTTGWHLALLDSARGGQPYLVNRDNTVAAGVNYPVDSFQHDDSLVYSPDAIAQGANSDVAFTYYVPIAYSEQDLTGGIFAAVNNATARLLLTLNRDFVQARTLTAGSDAGYVTATSGTAPADVTVNPFEIEVYQVYYDNLPRSDKGYILPVIDMGTYYDIKNSAQGSLLANQDYPQAYSNFRDFLSTFAIYRNRAAATGAQGFINTGDINHWSLETANFTNIFKVAPRYANAWARQALGNDLPQGVFYFPSRNKPISTQTYGNTNLVLNAADVQANASLLVGYESFFRAGTVGLASGLAPAG